MKSFIISLIGNPKFEPFAHIAHKSALEFGYDSHMFNAYIGDTGSKFILDRGILPVHNDSPLYNHSKIMVGQKPWIVKPGTIGCFVSHYALWEKCIELNETIVVLEHDALMIHKWIEPKFEDVLYLNNKGSIRHALGIERKHLIIAPEQTGVYEMKFGVRDNSMWTNYLMSTTFAYAINPQGAHKMIDKTKAGGWFAVDKMMASDAIKIETVNPSMAAEQYEASHISSTS